jgi:hypothetical protein
MHPWLLISLIVASALLLGTFLAVFLARLARAAQNRFIILLKGELPVRHQNGALLGGRASQSVRFGGNGILALTPTRLLFLMWTPRIDLELPLSHVRGARVESSWLGRVSPFLVVTFVDRAGKQDEVGWVASDPAAWASEVNARAGKSS